MNEDPVVEEMPEADALREAEDRVFRHPGYLAYMEALALEATIKHVVEPNWRELLGLLDAPNANQILAIELVQNVRPPIVREKFMSQLDQKLHNYLASAMTLTDHVRGIVKTCASEPLRKLDERKAELLKNPEIAFMQDLRNYTLHNTLPVVSNSLNVTNANQSDATMESVIELVVAKLLESKKWSATSKAYLSACGDAINLRPIVQTHGELILTFNTHFLNDLVEANTEGLDEVNKLQLARNAVLTGGNSGLAEDLTDQWTKIRSGEISINELYKPPPT